MTIYGTDMSHYDAAPVSLGASLVAEGFAFATHKAGGDANDAEIAAWWDAVKGKRGSLLLGAYWVLYPGNGAGRADQFLARLDATCDGWRNGPFVLQADCEKWSGDAGTVPSKSDIKAFCDRLVARCPKLRPIVYAPKWVYGNDLSGLGYPLWASAYVNGSGAASELYPGDGSSKWDAYSGQVPAVLQFTSSATIAGQTTCDANAYRGTLAQLTALVAPGWAEDMDLTSDNLADIAQAVASKMHLDYSTPTSGLGKDVTASEGRIVAAIKAVIPTAAQITASVVAALPPAATGGLTIEQVEEACSVGVEAAFAHAFPSGAPA